MKRNDFKWRHYLPDIILFCVRWYLKTGLSYQDLSNMMKERGLSTDKSCIWRWVQAYAPKIDKRARKFLKKTCDSYRIDETYIKVKGKWRYLYRAIDKLGNTIDFLLCAKRDAKSAKRFFKKTLKAQHAVYPRILNVDKNPAYPHAFSECQNEKIVSKKTKLRQVKYLNNIIEQDHRFVKKHAKSKLWFGNFNAAKNTLAGYEIMHIIHKGQIYDVARNDPIAQRDFISNLFYKAA